MGKLEGQISGEGHGECFWKINGGFTSHVFLTLKHDESISAMGLLLLVGSFVSMGIRDDSNLCLVSGEVRVIIGVSVLLTRSMGPNRPNSLSRSDSLAS